MGIVRGALVLGAAVIALVVVTQVVKDGSEPDYLRQEKDTVVQKVKDRGFDTLGIDSFKTDGDKHLTSARLTVYVGKAYVKNPFLRDPCSATVVWEKGGPGFPDRFDLFDTFGPDASERNRLLTNATNEGALTITRWKDACP